MIYAIIKTKEKIKKENVDLENDVNEYNEEIEKFERKIKVNEEEMNKIKTINEELKIEIDEKKENINSYKIN